MCRNAFFGAKTMKTEGRRPKIKDQRPGNQLNEMCRNAFFEAKTMKSIRSLFVGLPASNYKIKIPAKTLYLTLKHWNRWGLRFAVLPASNYKTKTLAETFYLTLKHWNQSNLLTPLPHPPRLGTWDFVGSPSHSLLQSPLHAAQLICFETNIHSNI